MSDIDCFMVVINIIIVFVIVVCDLGMLLVVVLIDLCELFDVIGIGVLISDEDIQNVVKQWQEIEFEISFLLLIGGLVLEKFIGDS